MKRKEDRKEGREEGRKEVGGEKNMLTIIVHSHIDASGSE